jgi:hypothetical protein
MIKEIERNIKGRVLEFLSDEKIEVNIPLVLGQSRHLLRYDWKHL